MIEALKQARQIVWRYRNQTPLGNQPYMIADEADRLLERIDKALAHPPQRTWVGLTDEEVKHEWEVWRANIPRYAGFAKGLEAKLKGKNFD